MLLPALLAALPLCAPALQDPPPRLAEVDALFADRDATRTPGYQVAVVRHGELVHSAGYGCAQLEYGVPITPATVFHVASVSKQFTAACVVLLEQDGKLALGDEVRAHLPWVPDFGAPLTLEQLVHHTSGLRDQWESLVIAGWRLDDVIKQSDLRAVVAHARELNFPSGTRHLYCNTGYTLLAEVVAAEAGTSFPAFARARLFEPLGMASTHVHDDHQHLVPGRAYSYHKDGEEYRASVLSFANAGATSLFTTAEDLTRWLDDFRTERVLDAAAHARLLERGRLADGRVLDYAGGLVHGRARGYASVGHNGADAGYRSAVVWVPELELGVAVLSNGAELDADGALQRVLAALVPEPADAPPRAPAAATPPDDEDGGDEPAALDDARRAALVGTYADVHGYALELFAKRERLYLSFAGRPRKRLFARADGALATKRGDLVLRPTDDGGLAWEEDGARYAFARVAPGAAPPPTLAELAGWYACPELEVRYEVRLVNGGLVVHHFKHGEEPLTLQGPDRFSSPFWFFQPRFTRDASGRVDGLRVSGSRVLELRFVRVDGP
ncbi:MAG: beta-lactamase family protein [Planctomycetes bacterium]|nr:beta-lactamase family protein [Planctomycetota bacterium]